MNGTRMSDSTADQGNPGYPSFRDHTGKWRPGAAATYWADCSPGWIRPGVGFIRDGQTIVFTDETSCAECDQPFKSTDWIRVYYSPPFVHVPKRHPECVTDIAQADRHLVDAIELWMRAPSGGEERYRCGQAEGIAHALAIWRGTDFTREWVAGLDAYQRRIVGDETEGATGG